jgi:hypothetical protein
MRSVSAAADASVGREKRKVRFSLDGGEDGSGGGNQQAVEQGAGHSMDVDEGGSRAEDRALGGSRPSSSSRGVPGGSSSSSGGRRGGRAGGGGGRGGQLSWQRPGFVPDHVRNPGRYTVYTFDEPVMVGSDRGGGRGAGGAPVTAAQHEVRHHFDACIVFPHNPFRLTAHPHCQYYNYNISIAPFTTSQSPHLQHLNRPNPFTALPDALGQARPGH